MIQHMVFVKWKPGTTDAAKTEVAAAIGKLAGIPGVTALCQGANLAPNLHKDLAYGFSCRVPDEAGLQLYRDHPIHLALAPLIRANADDLFVADIPA
jgi:hypothetical protein